VTFFKRETENWFLKEIVRGPNSPMALAGGNPDEPYTINTAAEADTQRWATLRSRAA
jgi:hypothetical protein